MRRITKTALSGFAGCALILGVSQAANGDPANITYPLLKAPTGDFQEKAGPFDGAKGTLRVIQAPDNAATGFKLTVEDINVENFEGTAGQEFGAHLHTGPCVDDDYAIAAQPATDTQPATPAKAAGSLAGPHYNNDVAAHGKTLPTATVPLPENPAEISPNTEVWFNLIPDDHGDATDDTKVYFVPIDIDSEMSIVIHVSPTDPATGAAGARQACFKLLTPDWAP